jgi:hypothetical protein
MKPIDIEKNEVLILDGTGPGVSSHFGFLSQIGGENLGKFKAIHAFSGGIFAYLAHLALQSGYLRYDLEEYAENLDRRTIEFYHQDRKSIFRILAKLVAGKPIFSWHVLDRSINYIFSKEFLEKPISSLPANFHPYVAAESRCMRVDSSSPEWGSLRVYDLLLAGSSIPFVFEANTLTSRFSDAVFAKDFRYTLGGLLRASAPTIIVSMWPRRDSDNVSVYRTLESGSGKCRLYRDSLSILLKIPMSHWRSEIRSLNRGSSQRSLEQNRSALYAN